MLNDKEISKLNSYLVNNPLKYKGPLIMSVNIEVEFSYVVKLKKYIQMISVGEWTDFLVVDVKIFNVKGDFAKMYFNSADPLNIKEKNYFLIYRLEDEIYPFIRMFDQVSRIKIENLEVEI